MAKGVYFRPRPLAIDRVLSRIEKRGDCWEWQGGLFASGYGCIRVVEASVSKAKLTHRLSYEWFVGKIPADLVIDHLCRNRTCCNPAHLEAVPAHENVIRGINGGFGRCVTMCRNGHEYTSETLFIDSRNKQDCRICRRERSRSLKKEKASSPTTM